MAAILLLVVGGVALVVFLTQRGSDDFPDTVLGYERLHGEAADRAERAVEDVRIADIEIRAAVYGIGDQPHLFAAVYDNYPEGVDIEAIVQGAAGGAEATGGEIDQGSLQTSEAGGYAFACMTGGGPGFLTPGGPAEQGVMCVFKGEQVGVIVTTHAQDAVLGLTDVRAFVEALEAA